MYKLSDPVFVFESVVFPDFWVDCVLICGLSSKLGQSAEFLGCKDVNVCREEAGEVMLPCAFEPYDPRTCDRLEFTPRRSYSL